MGTPDQFMKQLMGFCDKTEAALTEVPKEVARELRLRIAFRTPILTGRASGSWNASVTTPNFKVKPDTYLNPTSPWTEGIVDVDSGKLGDTYHVANGLDYIRKLDLGSSRKAPQGMTVISIAEVKNGMGSIVATAKRKAGL